ncbi:hypothetical protein V6N13_017724 [Hibiscus sabdariffa]|uniref:Uncharacterized protein n=1 Tax=Hibiscus sabdariffa TaxID=183260 RepID=A0ABR2CI34_9ROSI
MRTILCKDLFILFCNSYVETASSAFKSINTFPKKPIRMPEADNPRLAIIWDSVASNIMAHDLPRDDDLAISPAFIVDMTVVVTVRANNVFSIYSVRVRFISSSTTALLGLVDNYRLENDNPNCTHPIFYPKRGGAKADVRRRLCMSLHKAVLVLELEQSSCGSESGKIAAVNSYLGKSIS